MRLFASLLVAALAAGANAAAGPSASAPVRNRICQPCRLPAFGVAAPRHGMLLANSGVYGAGTYFVILDLDQHTLARGFVPSRAEGRPVLPFKHVAFAITPAETASLVDVTDRIWAQSQPLPAGGASDVFWEAWLADGDLMRRERGPGNPTGLAEEFEKTALGILSHYELAAHTIR